MSPVNTTSLSGKTITYEETSRQFTLQDHRPVVAQDVLNYDASGQIDWAKASFHDWVHEFAAWDSRRQPKTQVADFTSHPMLKPLTDLGYLVQELALVNQNTNRPSRKAAAKLAARCLSLAADVEGWRASFPQANPVTVRLCDCTVTFARAIAAVFLIPRRVTDSERAQLGSDYQTSRIAFNEATNVWYDYVEQLATSEGVRLSFDFN